MDDPKPKLNFLESTYLPEVMRGLSITIGHFLKNITHIKDLPTISYPEELRPIHDRYRGKHRLTTKTDGSVKCTACMLCATACPATCIHIEAHEVADPTVEKAPIKYEIDILRCVFCGLCVEACPCDAIRMDTGTYSIADYRRVDLVYDKEYLMRGTAHDPARPIPRAEEIHTPGAKG